MSDPVLELVDASLRYVRGPIWRRDVVWAVRGVSLAIDAGQTVGLVGESGSGKTSIGRLALGMVSPTSGAVCFAGEPLAGRAKRRRGKLQVVLQHPEWSLNPRLRCGTSVAEPLAILGQGGAAERRTAVAEMLALVGLDAAVATRFPHELSGGQRQRVAIARALITSPRFIVFDEVVSALDVSIQAQILNLIKRLQSERRFAALFISHELAAVRYVSDRVAVMYAGEIVETARSIDLYSAGAHPYTRALQAAARGDPTYQLRDAVDLPEVGCPVEPRCPMAIGVCREVHPRLRPLAGRMVACHRAEELPATPAPPPSPLAVVESVS
jgi:ABC-type glutathione transport system ATPase component